MQGWMTQIRKGLVELCLLQVLAQDGEAYGYEILRRLSRVSELELSESTLYPVLSRLAQQRLLSVRKAPSPVGPPRRYYRITPEGTRKLKDMHGHWKQLCLTIDRLFNGVETNDE